MPVTSRRVGAGRSSWDDEGGDRAVRRRARGLDLDLPLQACTRADDRLRDRELASLRRALGHVDVEVADDAITPERAVEIGRVPECDLAEGRQELAPHVSVLAKLIALSFELTPSARTSTLVPHWAGGPHVVPLLRMKEPAI